MDNSPKKLWVRDFNAGRLVIFEACLWGFYVGALLVSMAEAHPALALLAGLATIMLYFAIWRTSRGFVLCCILSVILWGAVAGQFAFNLSSGDYIWTTVAALLGGAIAFGSHHGKRDVEKNVEFIN